MRSFALLAIISIGVPAMCRVATAQPILPTGFEMQTVAVGLFGSSPLSFAFLPDRRILLIEKDTGRVHVALPGSTSTTVIATIPGTTIEGERGMLGIAVDPGWPARPYVYFHATYADSKIHVTLYTASGDLSNSASTNLTLGNPYVLLNDIPDQYCHHNGGTLRFGPDGDLYVSVGDDGGVCESQDVNAFNGKILRLDVSRMPGPGTGPPPKADITPSDNPFTGPTDSARLVLAYGLRNPFRFTIDPLRGNLYIGDVGALDWEEVDELVSSPFAGDNFGWPVYEGRVQTGCCGQCTVHPPFTEPIDVYPNPSEPQQSVAVIAGPLYRRVVGSQYTFPFQYDGNLFFADFYAGWMRRLVRTGNAWEVAPPVAGQNDPQNWATNLRYISDLQLGPDGAIYVLLWFGTGGPVTGLHRIVNTLPIDAPEIDMTIRSAPNPVRDGGHVTIRYAGPWPERARVHIYDATGRLVRTLRRTTGSTSSAIWDGRDDSGQPARSGLYIYDLEAGAGRRARGKISVVR